MTIASEQVPAAETVEPQTTKKSQGTILGASVIAAGTAVGAGMFSLPVANSGVWFTVCLVLMIVVGYIMHTASLYIMEVTLHFPEGSNYDSLAKGTIGNFGRIVNGLSVAFLCYVLTYAYISGGSSIITYSLSIFGDVNMSSGVASLIFAVVLLSIVMMGTKAVDRVNTVLIGGMIITFMISLSSLIGNSSTANLFPEISLGDRMPYAFYTISFLVASFGLQITVPTVTNYLGLDAKRTSKALLIAIFLAGFFYFLWMFAVFGNISRDDFPAIIAEGGNIGNIIGALSESGISANISVILQIFGNMAVATSFLGVSLSLYDYISDLFKFDTATVAGKAKTVGIAFVPTIILAILFPHGFIAAIGYAGVVLVIFSLLAPIVMVRICRERNPNMYQVPGGNARQAMVFGFGILVFIITAFELTGNLPIFG
ncbi:MULTISPECIES: amino acid permease [unclassified Pseudovibrio]|uniref:amino acid permease n=1 Tax=unclassified Pseudovibrio TaxID=2627060 RepID=UPI000186C114|nr:aromatic amino acid transport family protein [Pseudovibrio sp. JE062]EEA91833.1 aromatic amino acid transporter [Pseudovibrio sp. JE062]